MATKWYGPLLICVCYLGVATVSCISTRTEGGNLVKQAEQQSNVGYSLDWGGDEAKKEASRFEPKFGAWRKVFFASFIKQAAVGAQGIVLLSYAGWVDAGQYFVLETSKGGAVLWDFAPPAQEGYKHYQFQQHSLEAAHWQSLLAMVGQQSLKDYAPPAFDALEHEILLFTKVEPTKIKVEKRLFIGYVDSNKRTAVTEPYLHMLEVFRAQLPQAKGG